MTETIPNERRRFLSRGVQIAAAAALPAGARAARTVPEAPDARALAFFHTHTQERIEIVYAVGDGYVPQALGSLNRFMRDHYTGDVGVIDPVLFDLLHRVRLELGCAQSFDVISGYRCPATNGRLRSTRGGGVAQRSLHMDGRAIDVRLPGVALADLRDAALSLRAGGVGYYPRESFVHIDTGRVRSW
jgi:uncharacterized protein YcbK (DUF882 family)